MKRDLSHRQIEALKARRAWAATTALPRAFAEVVRSEAFRSLAGELLAGMEVRGKTDEALLLVCPELRTAAEACYAGKGPSLGECADAAAVAALDWWLATEIRHWGARWTAVDPTRSGSAPSTREALGAIAEEIRARPVPDAIARIVDQVQRRSSACPPER
jgi:hypothetical protein